MLVAMTGKAGMNFCMRMSNGFFNQVSFNKRIKIMSPKDCSRFDVCSANLCPLDAGLSERIWYADEQVCKSQKHGRHRWIRKQRSIQRRQTATWLDRPITFSQLFDASRKREVKPETIEHLKSMHRRSQIKCCDVSAPYQPGGMQSHAPMPGAM